MLLEDNYSEQPLIPVQLITVTPHKLLAITENHQVVFVNVPKEATKKRDKTYWESLKDIARSEIWIPITEVGHYLIDTDWLAEDEGQLTYIETIDERHDKQTK